MALEQKTHEDLLYRLAVAEARIDDLMAERDSLEHDLEALREREQAAAIAHHDPAEALSQRYWLTEKGWGEFRNRRQNTDRRQVPGGRREATNDGLWRSPDGRPGPGPGGPGTRRSGSDRRTKTVWVPTEGVGQIEPHIVAVNDRTPFPAPAVEVLRRQGHWA